MLWRLRLVRGTRGLRMLHGRNTRGVWYGCRLLGRHRGLRDDGRTLFDGND